MFEVASRGETVFDKVCEDFAISLSIKRISRFCELGCEYFVILDNSIMDEIYFFIHRVMGMCIFSCHASMCSPPGMAYSHIGRRFSLDMREEVTHFTDFSHEAYFMRWSDGYKTSRIISAIFEIFESLVEERFGVVFPYSSDDSAHSEAIIMKLFFLTDKNSIIKNFYLTHFRTQKHIRGARE